MGPRSLRVNLILWFTLIFALILALSDYVTYRVLHGVLVAELDSSLISIAAEHRASVRDAALSVDSGSDLPRQPTPHFIQLIDSRGHILAQNGLADNSSVLSQDQIDRVLEGNVVTADVKRGHFDGRIAAIKGERAGEPVAVVTGTGTERLSSRASRIALILLFIDVVAVAASIAGGSLIIGKALRPVDHITQRARQIGAGDLRQRLEYLDSSTEMVHLTAVLNEMFEKLQRLFESQRQFVQDAAHEIRSPLAALRCRLEVALRQNRDAVEYREVLRGALDDSNRLSELADDLFLLARADSDNLAMDFREVLLSDVVSSVHSLLTPIAEARHVSFRQNIESDCLVYADRDRLHQAFRNVAENALKYTPPGGQVTVTVRAVADEGQVIVEDTGIGIPRKDQKKIFDRFYRVDRARSRSDGGTGLGLAITDQVIRAHRGEIELESDAGHGSKFTIRLASATSLVDAAVVDD